VADVTPRRPPRGDAEARSDRPDDDRGQLVLVGALALAVLFVALAMLLNTAIYSGNLATRTVASDAETILEYHGSAVDVTERALVTANVHNASSYEDLHGTVRDVVAAWDAGASLHRAVTGDISEVRVVETVNGTHLEQTTVRNFTNESREPDWTVAEEITAYRDFTMTVERDQLFDLSLSEEEFEDYNDYAAAGVLTVKVTAASEEYTAFIGDDGSDVSVAVFRSTTLIQRCTANPGADGEVTVDFSNGSVGGQPCDALAFVDDVDGTFELAIADGNAVLGTYSLVTDTTADRYDEDFHADAAAGSPVRTPALYAVDVSIRYRGASTYYRATVEVTPDAE
jgi:hypothetical protein